MSGETAMYTLKPVVSLPSALNHRKTMYELRNIHEDERRGGDHTGCEIKIITDVTEQSRPPEYAALEARQEKILSQLAELKKQVSTLCDFLKQTNQTDVKKDCTTQEVINESLIIKANPKRPPYSILVLQKLWADTDVQVQSYVHSTIIGETPTSLGSNNSHLKNNVINLTVIWKEVEDVEFTSGLHNYCLTGEVNLLRYISRLMNSCNYEKFNNLSEVVKTDAILDLCHSLHFQESSKKILEILSTIATKLETKHLSDKYLPNIADIALWSAIKQISIKKLPSNLSKWFDTCEKMFT